MAIDYTLELQKLFIEFMISDHELYVRCNNITSSDFFDRSLRQVVRFIQDHANQYSAMPALHQIKAVTGIELHPLTNIIDDAHKKWFLDEYETFCRHKALARAILASTDKLEKKEYGAVEQLIKEAVNIGLAKELGMNYWDSPEERLRQIQEQKGELSTGWKSIDSLLFGGFARGELNIWAGGSGSGKSLFLQNQALNWAQDGHNVVYISLELSQNLCAMRLDSMLTGYGTRDLFRNIDDVGLQIRMVGKNSGNLQIVQLPNGITVNDLKAYIKEYQIQTNNKVDAVLVDYLDLMMPAQRKVPPSDLFVKDKLVSEELRNFAVEGNYLFSTASQLNRCLTLDTLVMTHSGYVKIVDINPGDEIYSNSGYVQVIEKLPITIQPVYQITLESGKHISCSNNHKFPTNNGLRTIATGLNVTDSLITIKGTYEKIISIELLSNQETIDINVSGNRLFYANDILTHNSAVDEPEFDHSHISGGLSKIQTADNVMGILASRAMKERGRIQVQLMKTRSSSGVGKKVELSYGIENMRIKDLADDEKPTEDMPSTMLDKLKSRSAESTNTIKPEIEQKINTDKLKAILKRTND